MQLFIGPSHFFLVLVLQLAPAQVIQLIVVASRCNMRTTFSERKKNQRCFIISNIEKVLCMKFLIANIRITCTSISLFLPSNDKLISDVWNWRHVRTTWITFQRVGGLNTWIELI